MNLINSKNVRELALDVSAKHRAGKFKRVSKAFLNDVNEAVRVSVIHKVRAHPSIGKTLK